MRRRDPHDDPAPTGRRYVPGPVPSLHDLQRETRWLWLICKSCDHRKPVALAPYVIRWGTQASSDKLRSCARCSACGNKGATLQHPGWTDTVVGFEPFPVEYLVREEPL